VRRVGLDLRQGLKSFTTSILARLSLFEMRVRDSHHLDEVHALADRVFAA